MVTVDEMREMVGRLEAAVRARAQREGSTVIRPRPYSAATQKEIADYEKYLGLRLPPSYRMFLEMHNGYDWLAFPGHMLPIGSLMTGGAWFQKVSDWKRMSADYGSGEVLDGIVIANLDGPNDWAYLDPTQPAPDGELIVVAWLSGDSDTFPTLLGFFEWCLEICNADQP